MSSASVSVVERPGFTTRPLADAGTIRLPRRDARLSNGFRFLTLPMDVIETSRGCPSNCKFCSITHMYGRSFRPFPMERVVADLKDIRTRGTRSVFLTDDNITYDIPHFRRVCQASSPATPTTLRKPSGKALTIS